MNFPAPNILVDVDITNPGQFFACCGLLKLADELWRGAEGWFDESRNKFLISAEGSLEALVGAVATANIEAVRPSDPYGSPLSINGPFPGLVIDWWETDMTGARDLKVWAGTMESVGIAVAMQHAMQSPDFCASSLLDVGMVVRSPEDGKKKEPYYFDARRTSNAHSRDVGFSPNDLQVTTIAHPAVELLCLIGLQFARPALTSKSRVYEYYTWRIPLSPDLLLPASTGLLRLADASMYRFENWFRTGQKKHKAFRSAIAIKTVFKT